MSRCLYHPGRTGVLTLNSLSYCEHCQRGIAAAAARVDVHVQPKSCFVWYAGSNNWQPISGTGCAHWVAHQLGIRSGGRNEQCLEGFTFRVRTLVAGKTVVPLAQVRVNDIYVTPSMDHTGLVIQVTPDPNTPASPQIIIRHDSSRQGRVAENEFRTYFNHAGSFYR